jgi:RNA polymerase sigma factor (sigma-70 family)
MGFKNAAMSSGKPDTAQERIARRWRAPLITFFRRRLDDVGEAEDMAQEVLIRLIGQDEERCDSYVFQIAQNLLTDRHRRQQVRNRFYNETRVADFRDQDPIDAHTVLQGKQQLALVNSTLKTLPERTRAIFVLYRFEGLSQDDIAITFQISTSAVKQQVAKAMATLAKALRDAR